MFQAYSCPWPVGHEPETRFKSAATWLYELERELDELKGYTLFPVARYLQAIDRMTAYLPTYYELGAPRQFILVVQEFIGRVKTRVSIWGNPLEDHEIDMIVEYANGWLRRRGGPLDMGRPEVKLVLYSLRELEAFNAQCLAIRNAQTSCSSRASTV